MTRGHVSQTFVKANLRPKQKFLIRPKQKFLGLRLAFMNVWDTFCIGKTMDEVHGPGPEKESKDP